MNLTQREHIATVVNALSASPSSMAVQHYDPQIRDSWRRCVELYGFEPGRMQQARILTARELNDHRQPLDEFRHIAQQGLAQLYQQIAPAGYMALLTDAHGVAIDYCGDQQAEIPLRRAGLFPGAQWSEASAGTCAVGTALATGKALTVHQTDHFDATHIPLTCSAVPLFDPTGPLLAIVDISALHSPQPKNNQHLALQIAQIAARQIENAWFSHRHRQDWILRLSEPDLCLAADSEFLLAFNDSGQLVGHNHRAQRMLETELGLSALALHSLSPLRGQRFAQIFQQSFEQLPVYPDRQASLDLLHSQRSLIISALVAPAPRRQQRQIVSSPLPAALTALDSGDAAFHRQLQRAAKLLNSSLSLVIHGETGSGKEIFAKAFHQASGRAAGPFIAINCAAIPATLIESELFGAMPGSFSGASSKPKRGLIQEANGGTLFLDEIGDMPLALQSRLLRVLAEREVLPVGASRPIPIDVRVISASHHPLQQRVDSGHFRADLYYRLNGARITLPPLRERSDLDALIDTLLAARYGISAAARHCLQQHHWPGNLRELRNVLDYACEMAEQGWIEPHDLPEELQVSATTAIFASPQPQCAEAEQLLQSLRAAQWNRAAVARQLGISRMTLYRRMQRLGIRSPLDSH
ncbi:sigma-54-dependent Fis family transcriptional regulator [Winslowiella iniecta]|uniref:ATPase AAA n=1 Tax=Winslowiella iniecta TaxID=1560201 RepID=A0A0L7TJ26_9GAMM|nr:sigma-54-dependent Fis family transcriptional regulator [Winslowiella iniecta]KOC89296.1 ATPase AAA [Winslowiella iniecta]KOC95349.1 ATPase AAA [Winslowiella iniecta]